jgi:hypothetical protein
MNWLSLIAASLTRAFWEIIWIPRTAQVQRIQEQMEALADEDERQFEAERERKKIQTLKEKGKMKRALLAEIRKDKQDFLKRRTARELEKLNLRKLSSTKKKRLSLKRNSPSIRPNPKRRKTETQKTIDREAEQNEEEEEEIKISTKSQKRKTTTPLSDSKRRKLVHPTIDEVVETEEEDEIPIIPKKRKTTSDQADSRKKSKQNTTVNNQMTSIQQQINTRQSERIKNKQLNANRPTNSM